MASEKELVQGLNDALRYEYQAVVMYNTYAAAVSGIHRGELKEFFLDEIRDELGHAEYLANKISAFGEEPATDAYDVNLPTDEEAMLENVRDAEAEAIERYSELMEVAEEVGELGLANDLHDIISDETTHKEETEKLLRGRTAR
jgi:bacterioferritin